MSGLGRLLFERTAAAAALSQDSAKGGGCDGVEVSGAPGVQPGA